MREGFRRSLERYNQQIKDWENIETKEGSDDPGLDDLATVIDYELARTSEARANSVETQDVIFHLQEEKQAIMRELHRQLKMLDKIGTTEFKPYKERAKKTRDVGMIGEKLMVLEDGKWSQISLGELLTDGDWGIDYILDDRTISRDIHKRFVVEEAKRKLQDLLDRQIIVDEITSTRIEPSKRSAYEGIAEAKLERKLTDWHTGHFAELLVKNLLQKISIDADADFEILTADVYQDVNQKIDFIVRRKMQGRGVRVATYDKNTRTRIKKVGIQFTINQDPIVLRRKKQQIRNAKKRMHDGELTDILLVSMPAANIRKSLSAWTKQDKPHGGPISFFDKQSQRNIIGNILKNIFSDDEIRAFLDSTIPRKEAKTEA